MTGCLIYVVIIFIISVYIATQLGIESGGGIFTFFVINLVWITLLLYKIATIDESTMNEKIKEKSKLFRKREKLAKTLINYINFYLNEHIFLNC